MNDLLFQGQDKSPARDPSPIEREEIFMTNMISDDPVAPDFTVKLQELKRKVPSTQRSPRSP